MLEELRSALGNWDNVADALGTHHGTICTWMFASNRGITNTSAQLVWLTWALICRPGQVNTVFDLATCGRYTESAGPHHAGRCSPRGDFKPRRNTREDDRNARRETE